MRKPVTVVPIVIPIHALARTFAIIMCSYSLRGTGAHSQIQNVLALRTFLSLLAEKGSPTDPVKISKSKG